MTYFWVTYAGGQGTITANDRVQAAEIAASFGMVQIVIEGTLPYPASPKINEGDGCPDFCFNVKSCLNRMSCPRDYACSE